MKNAPQVWPLPFGEHPVLDFETSASKLEIIPLARGETPRIESKRPGAPLDIKVEGGRVVVRFANGEHQNPWGGNPFDRIGGFEHAARGMAAALSAGFGLRHSALVETAAKAKAATEAEGPKLNGGRGGWFTLHVPAHLRGRISAHMGEIEAKGLSGCDLTLATSAGSLMLDDCRGRFTLSAKAGRILGRRVGGTFDVESGMGEATLDIVALDPGAHRVVSTMGAVKIELVPGLDVRIESRTVMGSTRTLYPSNNDAPTLLKLEAELGSVRVREGREYDDPRHGDWKDWRNEWRDVPVVATTAPLSSSSPSPVPETDSELRRILDLVRQKKVSPAEADRLISAINGN